MNRSLIRIRNNNNKNKNKNKKNNKKNSNIGFPDQMSTESEFSQAMKRSVGEIKCLNNGERENKCPFGKVNITTGK